MTFRAILLGLLGAVAICGLSYLNDAVMKQTYLVGNNFPISVYGTLILLLVLPVLLRFGRRMALRGSEVAVVLTLTLAACCVPGSGLLRTFTTSLVLPHHYARIEPSWKEQGVLERVPPAMLADPGTNDIRVVNGFIQGLGGGREHLAPSQVPWWAWRRTLAFWLPLILVFWLGLIALSVVVHRQWSEHEQLPYPIALFTASLRPGDGLERSPILGNRLFWIGTGAILAIHLNNYACEWFPGKLVRVPTQLDFLSLAPLFPTFKAGGGAWWPLMLTPIYFSVIAIAYFLAADVSFSLGIGGYLFTYIAGVFVGYGISFGGSGTFAPSILSNLGFGAFFGMLLVMLYTGRRYYSTVLRRAVFLPAADEPGRAPVWAARVFLVCFAAFSGALVVLGLDWPLAVLFTAAMVMMFLVMSRIMAETGIFFIQSYWFPGVILTGFLGVKALGPQAILLMLLLSTVMLIDPRESLMPFIVNSLKLVESQGVKVGRTALWCGAALILGLAVAVPVTLYFQYDRGANMSDGWAAHYVPRAPFEETVRVTQRLEAQGALAESETLHGWRRFAHAAPDKRLVLSFGIGLGLMLLTTAARLRFPRWPLHPVMFLMWYTYYTGRIFCFSLLIGWLIKVLVTRYGGAPLYQRLKPLMFGVIAGDLLGGVIPIAVSFVYYWITGEIPKSFRIMPG
jgi:hypothetical protein